MKSVITLSLLTTILAQTAMAQRPASAFDRGSSLQSWQDPRHADVIASCSSQPAPFRIGGGAADNSAPPMPALPAPDAIPGVIATGQQWSVVWSWEGNNADGPIAGDGNSLLFANNDASNVMRLDLTTGLATIIHDNGNTAGAVSRSKNGALFLATRGIGSGIEQLEPQRRMLADSFNGEPLECIGGVVNDLTADARGGVYFSVTGGGLFYANPEGVVSRYGEAPAANGIILSPDEQTLYVTNGGEVLAFDVERDGSLTNQRQFAELVGGQGGDGSAVDQQGRLYVATGRSADVFSPDGEFLGSIPGPQGMHGVAFGGEDRRTLYGIVFYGTWGTQSARNAIVGIPMIAQGYTGRAK
jgi:gluconolactonase